MIYLDYAATTPPDPQVIEAMHEVHTSKWGNASSAHAAGRTAKHIVDTCHKTIASYCHVHADEVIITGTGSESITLGITSVLQQWLENNTPGTIITTPLEHKAVQEVVLHYKKQGWNIMEVALLSDGTVDSDALEKLLTKLEDCALITMQWVNSEVGIIQPIEQIATIAAQHHVPFHCDASQGIGHLALPAILPDLLSFSPHKFYGPKGIGVLIAKKHIQIYPIVLGGGQEYGYRSGTENTAAMAGCTVAMQLLTNNRTQQEQHSCSIQTYFHAALDAIPTASRTMPHSPCISGTTNILLHTSTAENAVIQCDLHGIGVSTGSACSSGTQESHPTIGALGLGKNDARKTIRISTGIHTTTNDIDALIAVLSQL